jgi:hypothetical protein
MSVASVEVQRRRLTAAERDALLSRVQEGATYSSIGVEFGVSRERVRQIATAERKARKQALEDEVARDLDAAALRVRYEASLEVVERLDEPERWELLAAVVFPSCELVEASRAAALEGLADRDDRRCSGCGVHVDERTIGCRICMDRAHGRRRRARAAAARETAGEPSRAVA